MVPLEMRNGRDFSYLQRTNLGPMLLASDWNPVL
jgi:hypothetical protein